MVWWSKAFCCSSIGNGIPTHDLSLQTELKTHKSTFSSSSLWLVNSEHETGLWIPSGNIPFPEYHPENHVCFVSVPELHPTAFRKILNQRQIFEKSRFLLAYVTQGSHTLILVEISNAARLRLRSNKNICEQLQRMIYVSLSTVSSVIVCKTHFNIYMDKCAI